MLIGACQKNDETIDLRRILFQDNADTVDVLLKNFVPFIPFNRNNFFSEEFNNNVNNWPVYILGANSSNKNGFARIQNGEYQISGSSDAKLRGFLISRQIDTSRNFEINYRLKNEGIYFEKYLYSDQGFIFRGSLNAGNVIGTGLFLGSNSPNPKFSFRKILALTSTGEYYDLNTPNDYYEITLRKIGSRISVFVDKKFLSSFNSRDIYAAGGLVGFAAIDRMFIDFLKVEYFTY